MIIRGRPGYGIFWRNEGYEKIRRCDGVRTACLKAGQFFCKCMTSKNAQRKKLKAEVLIEWCGVVCLSFSYRIFFSAGKCMNRELFPVSRLLSSSNYTSVFPFLFFVLSVFAVLARHRFVITRTHPILPLFSMPRSIY